jgi:uncharacterized protein (DUF2225 family)
MEEERDKTKVDSLPLTCPVCGFFFITLEIRSFGYENRRTDFRPQYTDANPMGLYYHLCPECKFCAEQDYYQLDLSKEQGEALKDSLQKLYLEHGGELESSVAARCYYGARVAELLQEMGLVYELPFDRAQSFVQAFWWSEPKEMKEYGDIAIEKLHDATKDIDDGSEDTLYILYMMGEISRRLGRQANAKQYFEKLLGLKEKRENESNRFLFALGRQQMTSPKEEMPEESLNPFARR